MLYNVIEKCYCELKDFVVGMNEFFFVNYLKVYKEMVVVVFFRECELVIDKEEFKGRIFIEDENYF